MKIDCHKFKATSKDIDALKNYLEDPDAEGSLKIDILQWMFDNLNKINVPEMRNKKFHAQVHGFLILIGAK